ncbi:16S rRNA (cytidine(1402)-2'-O)-methyltransferase [Nocardia sp. 852002-20019_SCH5090214]|jgi:16S rRNA (cytidine1402-2'-O)-methyltransferase|uniref:Ribosomal RNA small subunit methyltransferase I n=1 Tax=Nocardia nova TaxID=37330 RepID=A0A2S5ZVN9_9NOCA|nr:MULTISPECIES: 16S rRNA (cytidine(1402)-2'-O)-methyltransferase [Nocardia]OBF86208.1 16S rRNA (cytidine(1402)-2'-O)-methyltransferase [Mycobacterium sp. 852002-51759_SCH5129042]MBF6277253.1 16S rRNA (cytidine(1402)-2'-O)-methyltransferase [Nocardia nova]MBV7706763.1 16S rRNA (cytidine(1402)-2'-O)-methyltransferase [Nocardia nova]OBA49276.1 16S rRNA (cytidine(1402)-2'-O)-methyltransferase [Nocardia sp. 852002-51101_SCH5132738]OBA65494.1 16S rRNA (cytidine(1402)-2'-O)-methyltransferase [Nocard
MGEHDGRLVLAATPMGDIGDASQRLRDALASADVVAAEDTRRTRALAKALEVEITGRVVSFYDHVEAARIPLLLDEIESGKTVLLVTDAGMPSVSDPGYRMVAACIERDLPVTCLPGPSAVTTALALSGLPMERFCFDGFAPRKSGQRKQWLATLVTEPRAVVFFEAPHRLADCLADAAEVLGPERRAAVCRELTKTYEEVVRGGLGELAAWAVEGARGEITVVVEGAQPVSADPVDLVDEVEELVADGIRLKDACAQVAARAGGVSRRELYDAVLAARAE